MKRMAPAALTVGVGMLLTACGLDMDLGSRHEDVKTYEIADALTELQVNIGAGDVIVNESDRSGVKVTETLQWRSSKPETERSVEGKALVLRYMCGKGPLSHCNVNYKVEIPKGLRVKIDGGAGVITLRQLSGELEVATGAGDIRTVGLAVKRLKADTGAGTVELAFVAPPDSVEATTGAGEVEVKVPGGPYDVEAGAGVGDVTVKVDKDPSSPRKIKVSSGVGDVKVLKS
ncbi:hypothetical protein SAMN05421505_102162 [Sinosporangium album]|uniref:DUF4097 domain-containing protein n=1 Tax=Sinosporangium album TaxID=504805 RepID=A0A1G7S4F9_9ACTN|nr:DUF4097 family beta strand repeat-containing protein [Sinosporangium album]SDG17893.1 hypothetical protein SAMN05421505_102162 [Sinosporangium album]